MLTNKIKLIVFIVLLAIIVLSVSSIISLVSIKDAKKENTLAQNQIDQLNSAIENLKTKLSDAYEEIDLNNEQLDKYQEIFNAWTKATPEVNEAVNKIMAAYGEALEYAHLFPKEKFDSLEDEMMDSIYGAIRSTEPDAVAKSFEKSIEKANNDRYDNVIKKMIENIKQGGVSFPEDDAAIKELREYYNGFVGDEAIIGSFIAEGIDKELKDLEALLDTDEENDLALAFEKAVADIKTPITLDTSLENANNAWTELCNALEENDVLNESTKEARTLLDSYVERVEQLTIAKEKADEINSKISALNVIPDVATQLAIESIEKEINAWIDKYEIDEANKYLVNDIGALKKVYENAIAELRALYEAFKNATESIGKVNVNSKDKIDAALDSFEKIKDHKDTDVLLSLESPDTVAELYSLVEAAHDKYIYLVDLINAIRYEIDRIHLADPDVTHGEIGELNKKVDELLLIEDEIKVLNTEKTDYVSLLAEARLLPYKNDAFKELKAIYDACYEGAQGDRDTIISLVAIKDTSFNAIEKAATTDEINDLVNKAKADFLACVDIDN